MTRLRSLLSRWRWFLLALMAWELSQAAIGTWMGVQVACEVTGVC